MKIIWDYHTPMAGTYRISFASFSYSGTRKLGVYLNQFSKIGVLTVSSLRPNWTIHSFEVTLSAGMNSLELRDSENSAEPDIDYLEITYLQP